MALLSSQIPLHRMVPLCRQLASMHHAGIPVLQSLVLAADQARSGKVRNLLRQMAFDIRQGATLHEAAAAQSKRLPRFFIELLGAGEAGGRLDMMLNDLADYYEDRLTMRRQIIGQLVYPAILLFVAWALIPFAMGAVRQGISGSSEAFNLAGYISVWALGRLFSALRIAVVVLVVLALFRVGIFQWVWGAFTTFAWPFSRVTRKLAMARFFRTLSLLFASGMNAVTSIERSAAVIANPYIERDLLQAIPAVRNGETLTEAFGRCRYVTRAAHEMLQVGEQSGKLDSLLRKLSEYFQEEALHALNAAIQIAVQLVMLVIFCAIGYFIINFYMTLYGGMFNELGI